MVEKVFAVPLAATTPGEELLTHLTSLPESTVIGLDHLGPTDRTFLPRFAYKRTTDTWTAFPMPTSGETEYWETVMHVCQKQGLNIRYLDGVGPYEGLLRKYLADAAADGFSSFIAQKEQYLLEAARKNKPHTIIVGEMFATLFQADPISAASPAPVS